MRSAVVTSNRTPALTSADRLRYPLGCLFGSWDVYRPIPPVENSHQKPTTPRSRAKPVKLRVSRYGGSQGRGDAAQQVATVREVLLARLDDIGATRLWPIAEASGLSHTEFSDMFQEMLLCLFPVECGDGEEYTPDPAKRQEVPAGAKERKGGLFPHPCEGVGDERALTFARHLLIGQVSPVAGMTAEDGQPLFSREELARLGERIVRKEAMSRSA